MELSLILTPIFSFVLLKMMLEHRSKAREDNVRLLEEALKNPALDRATIESLAYQLTGARSPRTAGPSRMMALLLAVGWVALFSGLGIWLIGEIIGQQGATAGGLLTSIVGFGLVTYPFALRELEARQKA
ncbi:MAG: hypothetical protein KA020_05165 [Planctomycetes bacterium]|jgi:hypothetical protein|nr:hypothetical protein [Planctomycetota bacterium]MCC7061881.1 hypothetical protein [Planctomycetota bacterium]